MWPNDSRWFAYSVIRPRGRLRLFCLPYAGRGADLFANWAEALPAWVDVCPIQLPGRGSRLGEPLFQRCGPLVDAIAAAVTSGDARPFALFGHSMGAILAFELARQLRDHGKPQPLHLFVSGSSAPHLPHGQRARCELPPDQFVAELERLNGTPKQVIESDELMRMLVPVLRADFAVCDMYQYGEQPPLECPITAFCGAHDPEAPAAACNAWAAQTSRAFTLHVLPGDHFFINTLRSTVLALVSRELARSCSHLVEPARHAGWDARTP